MRMYLCVLLCLSACTENSRARSFGGSEEISLSCGEELVTATWKEDSLWVLTKTAEASHQPTTHYFREESAYGLLEGSVVFKETSCVKP